MKEKSAEIRGESEMKSNENAEKRRQAAEKIVTQ